MTPQFMGTYRQREVENELKAEGWLEYTHPHDKLTHKARRWKAARKSQSEIAASQGTSWRGQHRGSTYPAKRLGSYRYNGLRVVHGREQHSSDNGHGEWEEVGND